MGEEMGSRKALSRVRRVLSWTAALAVGVTLALILGLGAVSAIAETATGQRWAELSNVGESFGLLNAIFSGLALAAVVVTFWMQFTELRSQRSELAVQRDALIQTQAELHRTAEASLRHLHVDLVKMSMNDPLLAAVWPRTVSSDVRDRQYQYANLILQHHVLRLQISEFSEAELQRVFRYLFLSPIMREFWTDTANARAALAAPGSFEQQMHKVGNAVCAEYEHLLQTQRSCATTQAEWDERPLAEAA
ncbi:DUF6082 family protein [Asanoa sp. WMMD1127]|uniref:DUF6082 family protein n=1 Tax=Asanoa sp. WMMD1127 TaxID=3016107 RepID=UPI002417C859|nr:DUF6082 family protein [Asanoa sp. WMMD1127]MDG4821032.1 DUF6082 family protein [Asanoa sp. WMMD1127]